MNSESISSGAKAHVFPASRGTVEAAPSRKSPLAKASAEFWLTQIWLLWRSAAALYFFEIVIGESVAGIELQSAL